ncbi:MAG: phage tail sheath C-terminal domain-containing protein [Ferruginibacter sp.]
MATYKTPGVYIEEISTMPPSVAEVETAIPAFIGFTEKGTVNSPVRITSLVDYELYFGVAEPETDLSADVTESGEISITVDPAKVSHSVMYYAMQLYFSNGGGPCYIVSIGNFAANPKGEPAASFKLYSDALKVVEKEDEPTLLVFPDAPFSLIPDQYYKLIMEAITQCTKLGDRFTIVDVIFVPDPAAPTVDPRKSTGPFRDGVVEAPTANLKYAAAYFPYLNTTISPDFEDTLIKAGAGKALEDLKKEKDTLRAASTAAKADFDAASALPDTDPEKKNKVATTRRAADAAEKKAKDVEKLLSDTPEERTFTNLLVNKIELEVRKMGVVLTPCAAVAGVYAAVDNERGVWKAPANVSLLNVKSTTVKITNDDQDDMNIDVNDGKSINAIRPFIGKGVKIWGGRTLDGNDNEWRYINVRRFFNMVEESVKKSTYWAVFEPNDINTWIKVRAMIENYLILKWRDGALAGAKPEDAFYVRVGLGQTMTSLDVLEGRMIIEIGMAAVRPAEFIILKFSHKLQTT